jgi:hypothetical protein
LWCPYCPPHRHNRILWQILKSSHTPIQISCERCSTSATSRRTRRRMVRRRLANRRPSNYMLRSLCSGSVSRELGFPRREARPSRKRRRYNPQNDHSPQVRAVRPKQYLFLAWGLFSDLSYERSCLNLTWSAWVFCTVPDTELKNLRGQRASAGRASQPPPLGMFGRATYKLT